MPTLGELVVRLRADGAMQTQQAVQGVVSSLQQASTASQQLSYRFDTGRIAAFGLGLALREVLFTATAAAHGLSLALGLDFAARMQQLQVGFETLLGSASAARQMLGEIVALGARTPFRTDELIDYARRLLAVGFAGEEVLPVLRAITDAAAAVGGSTETVFRISLALSQIASMPRLGGQEIIQLANAGINVARLVSAATGRDLSMHEAREFLRRLPGREAADILIRGMQVEFGGSAERLAGRTLIGIVQNLGETMRMSLLPTAERLVTVLTPLANAMLSVLNQVRVLNEATGGAMGLSAVLGIMVSGWNILRSSFVAAVAEIRSLSAAIRELAASAGTAAAATSGAAAGTAAAGAAAIGGAAAGLGLGRIRTWLGNAMRGPLPYVLVSLLGSWVAELIGGQIGQIVQGALSGLSLGAIVGSLVPGLGSLAGGIIGAALGLIWGLFKSSRADAADPAHETARNTGRMAQALDDIRGQLIGGGRRGAVASDIEMEIALARLLRTGIA